LPPPCYDPNFILPEQAKVPCIGILVFDSETSFSDKSKITKNTGAFLRYNYHLVNATAVFVPDEDTLNTITGHPKIVKLIPDRPVHKIGKPDKPGKGKKDGGGGSGQELPSGVERIGAAPSVGLSVKGLGIGIAIADTGIDFSHSDLAVSAICFSAFGDCGDVDGHGTHVAGIATALDNSIDTVGVAPKATPYAVKVLDDSGSGSDGSVIAGLDWIGMNANIVSPKIKVVNMSLGRPGSLNDNPVLRESIRILKEDMGITIVAAAGNSSSSEVSDRVPATYPEVLAVASMTAKDGSNNRCRFFSGTIAADTAAATTTDGLFDTGSGIGVTISAPGTKLENISRSCHIRPVGILSLQLGGGTTRLSGTSMASPLLSGVAALLIEKAGGSLDPESIRTTIRDTAFQMGTAPIDSPASGYTFDGEREGVLSACDALGEACP